MDQPVKKCCLTPILLNKMGEGTRVSGSAVWSTKYALSVIPGCSAFEYIWFFCAMLLAFPAPLNRKIPGIIVGIALLLSLNLLRITSLYLVGVHFPRFFETAHE